MKRFYKEVGVAAVEGGHGLMLDGRPVKTPGRAALAVPTAALAEAIAGEWAVQGETIDPRSMPLTGLANAAIDRIAPDREAFATGLARYGESDLLCYRADGPPSLVARQAEAWDPLLAWARGRYDVELVVTSGIVHRAQPVKTIDRLTRAVGARDAFALAGLSPLVTVGGSLILALAVAEGDMTPDDAWATATVEEEWQAEKWGEDGEARVALTARCGEFMAGARFLTLL